MSAGATASINVEMAVGGFEELVVVVGTRAQPRSVTDSAVPVDVIRSEDFVSQGSTDLADQLRTVVPSFNISIQPISDAATIVRPASLRNLAPDHTLVLVNGKRRHRAAVITWLGNGIADGSQGPDLSVIPSIAIRQAEVLRDGAAAQYGSDAIAGVMNFQLKDARSGGSLEFRTGAYLDANPGSLSTCGEGIIGDIKHSCNGIGGRGQAFTVAGNAGLPIGRNGFVNLSLEYGNAGPTNRSIQRTDAQNIIEAGNTNLRNPAQIWGSPKLEDDLKLFVNFGHLFANPIAILRPHQLREPHGDWRLLLPEPAYPRRGLPRPRGRRPPDPARRRPGLGRDRRQGRRRLPHDPGYRQRPRCGRPPAGRDRPNCFTLHSRFPAGSRRSSAATSSTIR